MTSSQVNEQIEKARVKDEGHQKENADKFPMAEILTTLMVGGMDRRAEICPVFSLRLRSSEGINIVMSMKNTMKSWDDNSIGKAVML